MDTAIEISDLTLDYGARRALDHVSLAVGSGQFCGLLGANGAGKSTLFALLTGLLPVQSGAITLAGIDISRQPRQALRKIGIVFQQPTLELDMTVEDNLRYFAALHGRRGRQVDTDITERLARVRVSDRRYDKVRALNGGHRRRMEIARALMHHPEILLLDEPTVGLDVAARREIVEDVHQLAADGLTVLWASHLVDEFRDSDQIVIIHHGQILDSGQVASVRGDQSLIDHFLGLSGDEVPIAI